MKYPRTPHLPWSPGATYDDERIIDVSHFFSRKVVVTEKMDGECTTIHRTGCHARSLDTSSHPIRTRVRALAGEISPQLPENWRIVGENVYATHSIHYEALPSHFLVFGICEGDSFLSWKDTEDYAEVLGLHCVPVLYQGPWDESAVLSCFTRTSRCGGDQEGYVVRLASSFPVHLFARAVAKYVRAGHVQSDEHWMHRPVIPNGFATHATTPLRTQ